MTMNGGINGIEKVDVEILFFYSGEETPINLDLAYLSIYSEDVGEGISSEEAKENYLYSNTTVQYHQSSYKSSHATGTYNNLFVGNAYGSTEVGNAEKVGFCFENKKSLKLTLYALTELKDVGYHFRYTPLTGVIPDAPTKTVDKTKAHPGDEVVYEIKQDLIKTYDKSFTYTGMLFKDKLDSNLEYVSFKIVFSNGEEITGDDLNKIGRFEFNQGTNQITWEANSSSTDALQKMKDVNGGWMKFVITAKIKETKTNGEITNKANTKIQNEYDLETNTTTTIVEPKRGKVNVHYIEKNTNTELAKEEIEEVVDTKVNTKEKQIEGYTLAQKPDTEEYIISENIQDVYYYYVKNAKVIVKYLDKTTNEQILEPKEIIGHEGQEYEATSEKIENYNYIGSTENTKGTMKDTIEVIYYYEPLLFNMGVDQIIDKLSVDGEETFVGGILGKTEINRKLTNYDVKIYYTIKVTNNMELAGNTLLKDYIPEGFVAKKEENTDWDIDENEATVLIENLEPNETREYEMILTNTDKSITGVVANNADIENSTNKAGYDETTYEDNKSKTEVILGVTTGFFSVKNKIIMLVTLILILTFIVIYIIRKNTLRKTYFSKHSR